MRPDRFRTAVRDVLRAALSAALVACSSAFGVRAEPAPVSEDPAAESARPAAVSEGEAPVGDAPAAAASAEEEHPPALSERVMAGPPTLESVLARLEKADEDARSVSFRFEQTAEIRVTGETQKIRGTAHFRKPDCFRIEQRSSPAQTVVSDGKTLWIHSLARRQVFVDSWENWSRAAGFPKGLLTFTMETADLRQRYDIAYEGRTTVRGRAADALRLAPRDDGPWPYTFRLWIDPASGLPFRTELESQSLRAVTEVSKMRVNPDIPDEFFVFQPPEGTAVFGAPGAPK